MDARDTREEFSLHELALEVLVISLCRNLARVSPELGAAVNTAFSEATGEVENLGFLLGDGTSGQLLTKGAQFIDTMRNAAVGRYAGIPIVQS